MQWKDHQGVVVDRHRHGRVPTPKVVSSDRCRVYCANHV